MLRAHVAQDAGKEYNQIKMDTLSANLIDFLEYRKLCGENVVELETESIELLHAFATGKTNFAEPSSPAPVQSPTFQQTHVTPTPPSNGNGIAPAVAPTPTEAIKKHDGVDFIFVGEQEGIPADRAAYSELLLKMVKAMGYNRNEVVFTNICIGRKGSSPPSAEEMAAAMPAFRKKLAEVAPRGMVILGATASLGLLGKPDVSSIHGRAFKFDGIPVVATYHPAYMMKLPIVKRDVCRDLCNALKIAGLPVSPSLSRFQ